VLYDSPDGVRHAYKAQNTWISTTLLPLAPSVRVEKLDIDIDDDGTVHAAWTEADESGVVLKYASSRSAWTVEEVAAPVQVDDFALGVTRDGQAHMVILDRSLRSAPVHYGQREADAWSFELLSAIEESNGFGHIALAVEADGSSHVLLSATLSNYATNRSGRWEAELILLSADDGAHLVIDESGAAHAVSRYFNYPNNTAPQYKTNQFVELDGVDQNCDGVDGLDEDQDGLASRWTGGSDCDDTDAQVWECVIND
jgi:hypothetical protein